MSSPTVPSGALQEALSLHKQGKLDEASKLYRQILAADPRQASALHLMGLLAVQQERAEEAVGWLQKSLAVNPNSAVCWSDLGLVLGGLGEFDQSEPAFQRAVELQAQFPEALWNWGNLCRDFCYYDRAISCYHQALAQRPQFTEASAGIREIQAIQAELPAFVAALDRARRSPREDGPGGLRTFEFVRRELFPKVLNQLELKGVGVEVGVQEGRFSERILRHWEGQRLYSVDPWREFASSEYVDIANASQAEQDRFYQRTIKRLMPFQRRSTIWRLTSQEAAGLLPDESLDFCYIDADHSYEGVQRDLRLWFPKVKPGGVLAGHDYVQDGEYRFGTFGVQRAVREFVQASNLQLFITCEGQHVVNSRGECGFPSWFVVKRLSHECPNQSDALLQLAIDCEGRGQLSEAEALLRKALAGEPNSSLAHLKLAAVLERLGRLEEAQRHAETAVRLEPENPEACLCLGTILVRRNLLSDAVPFYNQAVQLDPVSCACAIPALRECLNEGIRGWEKRLQSDPADFEALLSLAKVRYSERKPEEAVDLLQKALLRKPGEPNAEYALGFTELLLGKFETGWMHYEARWRTGQKQFPSRPFTQPRWTGEPLAGKTILVFAEQGIGDTLQFVRYVPPVTERVGRVIFECQPALKDLLATARGIDRLVAHGEALPPFDVQIPLLSLPLLFRTSANSIPAAVPYLKAPENATVELPSTPEGWMKVGVVWAGNPGLQNDLARSVPLPKLSSLWSVPKVAFFSLQVGPAGRQLALFRDQQKLIDLKPQLSDFARTAAAIEALDLVISVDTAVAHLAGALGKPVWLLLPFAPEWRWLLDREASPWYPTMRLFRQPRPDDWDGVVERVRANLLSQGR
ncbi:MAG: tetratricopeptide repeat protein [Verrucomicrobia bacterium]|nr:tetratricopeptide repeat protein [Verrucomicrobiota bacterium]